MYLFRLEQNLAIDTCCDSPKAMYGVDSGNGNTMTALHVETRVLVVMLFALNLDELMIARSNLDDMIIYRWNIFKKLNYNNLFLGRFVSPYAFYVPHFDRLVSVDNWSPTLSTSSFTTTQSVIYSSDS